MGRRRWLRRADRAALARDADTVLRPSACRRRARLDLPRRCGGHPHRPRLGASLLTRVTARCRMYRGWNVDIGRQEDFAAAGWLVIRVTAERMRHPRPVVARVSRRFGKPAMADRSGLLVSTISCNLSPSSHWLTFIAAITPPSRSQKAVNSRVSKLPRTTS